VCGIAGAFRFEGPPDRAAVPAMVRALGHRGPDEEHLLALPDGAMGTRRLAIIDLEGGRQPLIDGDRRLALAMNGEVYNHESLRRMFEANGARFGTASDTEAAACAIATSGIERGLSLLDGQFAIAAYDLARRTLHLARDRIGQKPLYWTRIEDGTLLFASELKGLLAHPGVRRRVDPRAVEQLLLFEYVPAPRTIYQGVYKLEPGCVLTASADGQSIRRWWTPPLVGADRANIARERFEKSIWMAVQVAVKARVVAADVPVGCLLSGGIDSSTVAALAARFTERLRTFSMGFDEPSFDESGPAEAMAAHLGSEHTRLRFSSGELDGVLGALERGMCEPLADGSLPSTWLLCQGVRDAGFKAVLSGDGADEHFGGYPTYRAHRLAGPAAAAGGLLRRAAARLPASTENLSVGFRARRFAAGLGHPLARRNQIWLGAFLPEELPALLGRSIQPWAEVDAHGARAAAIGDPAEQAMYLDQRLYLGEGVLAKVDRASMLASVEVRSPFMDHRLAEMAAQLPAGSFIAGGRTKLLLRRSVAHLLPPALVERPKKGFGTPLGPWLRGPCGHLLDDLPERLEGVCAPAPVRALVAEHRGGHRDHRRRLWSLIVLSRWWSGPWGPSS